MNNLGIRGTYRCCFSRLEGGEQRFSFLTSSPVLLEMLFHRIIFSSKVLECPNALLPFWNFSFSFSFSSPPPQLSLNPQMYSDKRGLLVMKGITPTANFHSCWPLCRLPASLMFASEGPPPWPLDSLVVALILCLQHTVFSLHRHLLMVLQHKAQFQEKMLEKGSQPWPETSSDLSMLPSQLPYTSKHLAPSLIPGLRYKVNVTITATLTTRRTASTAS